MAIIIKMVMIIMVVSLGSVGRVLVAGSCGRTGEGGAQISQRTLDQHACPDITASISVCVYVAVYGSSFFSDYCFTLICAVGTKKGRWPSAITAKTRSRKGGMITDGGGAAAVAGGILLSNHLYTHIFDNIYIYIDMIVIHCY